MPNTLTFHVDRVSHQKQQHIAGKITKITLDSEMVSVKIFPDNVKVTPVTSKIPTLVNISQIPKLITLIIPSGLLSTGSGMLGPLISFISRGISFDGYSDNLSVILKMHGIPVSNHQPGMELKEIVMQHINTYVVRMAGAVSFLSEFEQDLLKLSQDCNYQLRVYKERLELYELPTPRAYEEHNHFDYTHEILLANLTGQVLQMPEVSRVLYEYLMGAVSFEITLEKLAIRLKAMGQVETPSPFDKVYAALISGSIITGAPNIEVGDLPELTSVKQEEPIVYTRSEVIEIIKMIRPDIADVQSVIDKLLFKA